MIPVLRYLFLDIDGVLNMRAFQEFSSGRSVMDQVKFAMDPDNRSHQTLMDRLQRTHFPIKTDELDPLRIGAIGSICARFGVKVVLSSDWRTHFHELLLDDLFCFLSPHWQRGTIIGKTPAVSSSFKKRLDQINAWIETIPHQRFQCAIVDDNYQAFPALNSTQDRDSRFLFVKTDADDGLLIGHYLRLEAFFSKVISEIRT